ncbi:MAG: cytochrome c [Alphaproteobacteria bacterium]|nr:cytochrome c [Alphaproteobacteria bacterium]
MARPSILAVVLCGVLFAGFARADTSRVERGKYLLYAGGCITCHTDIKTLKAKGPILGGGEAIKTPFGIFYGPNITPHKVRGIGRWREVDFIHAMREGRSPSGHNYFPSFPYTSFTKITDNDLKALWAYMRTLKPVDRPSRRHDLNFPFNSRFMVRFWKWLNFRRGPTHADRTRSKQWNRGAYLVTALGHCGECHTPRGPLGGVYKRLALSGVRTFPDGIFPNITPDKATGIGQWSASDIVSVLKLGILPDGDFVSAEMVDVVEHGTSHLSDSDLKSIAVYLKSVKPIRNKTLSTKK